MGAIRGLSCFLSLVRAWAAGHTTRHRSAAACCNAPARRQRARSGTPVCSMRSRCRVSVLSFLFLVFYSSISIACPHTVCLRQTAGPISPRARGAGPSLVRSLPPALPFFLSFSLSSILCPFSLVTWCQIESNSSCVAIPRIRCVLFLLHLLCISHLLVFFSCFSFLFLSSSSVFASSNPFSSSSSCSSSCSSYFSSSPSSSSSSVQGRRVRRRTTIRQLLASHVHTGAGTGSDHKHLAAFAPFLLAAEVVIIVLYGLFATYGEDEQPALGTLGVNYAYEADE
mgnify:CR=1 FL=1